MAATVSTAKSDAPKQWSVITKDGSRTLLRGGEKDARSFVVNNFPRVHAEPFMDYGDEGPEPDVYVQESGSKTKHVYVNEEWEER